MLIFKQERVEDTFKKEEDRQYVRRWFENDIEPIEEVKSQENDEMEIEDNYVATHEGLKGQNTGQAQAKVLDRTFVSQGSVVSVFMSNDEENTLDVSRTLVFVLINYSILFRYLL